MRAHTLPLILLAVCAPPAPAQTADFRVVAQFGFTTAMSGDGERLAGVNGSGEQVLWTPAGAETPVPVPAFGEPRGLSLDGSVLVGSVANFGIPNFQPYRWATPDAPVGLGGLVAPASTSVENILAEPFGISRDGMTVVGFSRSAAAPPAPSGRRPIEAFRWRAGVMTGLGDLPGGEFASAARAASADGGVVVGDGTSADGPQAFVWDQAGGQMTGLPELPGGDFYGQAFAVSDDGSTIVGRSGNAASGPGRSVACLWQRGAGGAWEVVEIGDLPGSDTASIAYAVSGDGSVVVGEGYSDLTTGFGEFEAIYYTRAGGLRNLREMLQTDYGVDLAGWILFSARSVSRDGRTISGTGLDPDENSVVWWVRLPAPACPADFNGQNGVELLDIFAFLNAWFGGCTGPGAPSPSCTKSADFNDMNGVDLLDIFAFLNAWFAGC